ncbi:17544_t:CDS:2 [Funneliformis geosporum]|uniref:17544_t:CDS:1 n=1 Tax=Funneliformis geosporum TaxID=1117311 RepID=A0A9W4WV90_9GLOM|nr:17544_t:CDS:2 [Funneliformis geosporum]
MYYLDKITPNESPEFWIASLCLSLIYTTFQTEVSDINKQQVEELFNNYDNKD